LLACGCELLCCYRRVQGMPIKNWHDYGGRMGMARVLGGGRTHELARRLLGVHAHDGRRCHGLPAWAAELLVLPPSGKAPAVEVLSGKFQLIFARSGC
jgi:hypothetical protein